MTKKNLIYLKIALYSSNTPLLCAELRPSLVAARSHLSNKPAPGSANRSFLAQTSETLCVRSKDPLFILLCQQPTKRFRATFAIGFEDRSWGFHRPTLSLGAVLYWFTIITLADISRHCVDCSYSEAYLLDVTSQVTVFVHVVVIHAWCLCLDFALS